MPRKKRTDSEPVRRAAPAEKTKAVPPSPDPPKLGFPIVGIGASAGGLAAFEAFLSAMPADTDSGMAFVLVQHLAPDHKSILTDLVKRYTRMQVYEVEDGMTVKPNCTYIIPPNRDMAFLNGTLRLFEPAVPRGLRLPIDFFFRSLAQDQHELAICIVLSGTGSDGTLGVRAVKGEGGLVMAQDPVTTEHNGMPRSAIATGLVDYVLPPADMPAQLLAYVAHVLKHKTRPAALPVTTDSVLKKICILIRAQTGHDFSQYKESTLLRRVERRMAMQLLEKPDEYLIYLQRNPVEIEALFRDLLISVTNFFRDPEAFTCLQTHVIPRLFAGKTAGESVRVWVCGCSTGEEAYSLAILIREHLETLKQAFVVQVYATDVDNRAIDHARAGVFPASIGADISPERLARYFTQDAGSGDYRIQKSIRDMLVFSEQDVIKDPPFSKLDLISCRNLLIYLNSDLQKKLIPLFHYALNPGGVLFLGSSESVGDFMTLFTVLERKWKIYLRQDDSRDAPRPPLGNYVSPFVEAAPPSPLPTAPQGKGPDNLRKLTEQALLTYYNPAGILVNGRGEILHIYGRTGQYLEPPAGDAAGMNALTMARAGLQQELTFALRQAVAHNEVVHQPGLRVKTNGDFVVVNLVVGPVTANPGGAAVPDVYLIILEQAPPTDSPPPEQIVAEVSTEANGRIAVLEKQLRNKEEYLQTTIEEMETANEELKSTNEEMQSVNEELQSTNEELETSKEELQSVNEELSTVNAELQAKVAELSQVNNDMNNLLAGTGVATLFVDMQLRITRFTPGTAQIINLIPTDLGRPVGHVVANLVGYDRLVDDIKKVLDSLIPVEEQVQTTSGVWYLMHIRPYRTLENVIEGAVITFVDITARKQMEETLRETARRETALREAQARLARDIVDTVREPLLVLDERLRVVMANPSFFRVFQVTPDETAGNLLFALGNRQWDIPALRPLLDEILAGHAAFDDFEVTHNFERIGQRTMLLNARRLASEAGQSELILLAIEDVTGRKS